MSQERHITLELTEAELRKQCDLCSRELLKNIYHHALDLTLDSLAMKVAAALAPKSEVNDQEQTPA